MDFFVFPFNFYKIPILKSNTFHKDKKQILFINIQIYIRYLEIEYDELFILRNLSCILNLVLMQVREEAGEESYFKITKWDICKVIDLILWLLLDIKTKFLD